VPNSPPISIITDTPTSTPTLAPTATPATTFTITSSPTYNPYPSVFYSPNGKFLAKKHIYYDGITEYDKPVIEIWNQSGDIAWKISYQRDWDHLNPRISMHIYGWSPDSSTLYFYYSRYNDSGLPTLSYVLNLQSLDINSGQIKYVLPISIDASTAFAFSPDMNKIAFISGNMVSILNLGTKSETKARILTDNFDDAGWIYYSPSGKKLIYHTMVAENAFAILINPQTMEQKIIYHWTKFSIGMYEFDGWSSDEYPRYIDYEKNVSFLDLSTLSQILIGTATPTP
jgi:hypothetical protein